MDELEICAMSLVKTAAAIKARQLSPVEIMDATLKRIERLNPVVNAYCTMAAGDAMRQAREKEAALMQGETPGELYGVPVSIKDLIFTRGIRTTAGSPIYKDFVPGQDAICVERLKAAGAIVIGKTNTCEFGWSGVTDNPLFGPTRNPWNLELTPGGSSGGAAVSIALCLGPLAIGSDAGGSLRIPGSFCGVFGFKPSYGRVPQYPEFPGWELLCHTGPITRTVEDAALAMEIIAGRDDRDRFSLAETGLKYRPLLNADLKGLKIAWSRDMGYATVDPEISRITEAAVKTFAASVPVNIEEASPDAGNPEDIYYTICSARLTAVLQDKIDDWGDQITPSLAGLVRKYRHLPATDYIRTCFAIQDYWDRILPFFNKYDLLLTPTVAARPFPLGSFGPREIAGKKVSPLEWMAFVYPFDMTGQPAASIPCGWTEDGLPVGLQIVGRRFDDATVLRAAAAFEQALPWLNRLPAIL